MKKFFFRSLFSGNELDVIHKENIDLPVFHTKLRSFLRADRVDDLIREFF